MDPKKIADTLNQLNIARAHRRAAGETGPTVEILRRTFDPRFAVEPIDRFGQGLDGRQRLTHNEQLALLGLSSATTPSTPLVVTQAAAGAAGGGGGAGGGGAPKKSAHEQYLAAKRDEGHSNGEASP